MSDTDIELLKLQIQREQNRADLLKWVVVFIWPLVVNVATAYVNNVAIASVATKAAAVEVKQDAITATSAASMQSWKAYDSKRPEDVDAAAKAIDHAEKLIEKMPAVGKAP